MSALDIPPATLPPEHHDRPGSGAFSYIARSPVLAQILARADLARWPVPEDVQVLEVGNVNYRVNFYGISSSQRRIYRQTVVLSMWSHDVG